MDVLERLNGAVAYIEANLCGEIDVNELSRITYYTPDGFNRFFSYMTQTTLAEYIRKRRLTRAAYDLRDSDVKVIDMAFKYGYASADAFTKAFIKQHGMTPTKARDLAETVRVYPPVSFHILIKGARDMELKIIDSDEIVLKGLSQEFTGPAFDRFEQEHPMWADNHDDVRNKVNTTVPGIWHGIWNKGVYSIAKRQGEADGKELEHIIIPSGKYAVFMSDFGGFAGVVLPKLREQIFDSWIADSVYKQTADYEVEVYYLFSRTEKHKRHYEIWRPVLKK
jgi:AraC family transcriptional regulator